MLLGLVALACRLPSDGSGNESDADTDSDTDADSDADGDTDTDTDWGAYTGPPRLVITASDAKKGISEWALYDLETLLWRIHGEAVDAREVVPTCSAAWVALLRQDGQDADGVDLKDAESGFTLNDILLPEGARPRSAFGLADGWVAVGLDTGNALHAYLPDADLMMKVDLSSYADASNTVHVAALASWQDALVVILDAGAVTDAMALVIDVELGAVVDTHVLTTADISDEIAIVDDWLYVFGLGDAHHPDLLDARNLSTGVTSIITADGLGQSAFTAASFASDGLWVVGDDGEGTASVFWLDFDPLKAISLDGAAPSLVRSAPVRDVAAEGATAFWLAEGDDGHTVTRYDAGGKALGSWIFSAPAAVRTCGADSL